MWILKFLPDWIFYFVLISGLLGLLLSKFIPGQYRLILQAASAAFFVFGTFMAGAIHDNEAWVARVKEMEVKVAQAQTQSKEENKKIEQKAVTQIQIIKQRGDDVIKYIDREVTKYDNDCKIPNEFIKAHNNASERPK